MADVKLFNINGKVKEYQSGNVTLEKELQTVIENNMETFFGVTFLASKLPMAGEWIASVLMKTIALLSLNINVL